MRKKLGVNIDHIATLRQARQEGFPDPVKAALLCESAGADSIVCHLRRDRRHIQDRDLLRLRSSVRTRFNLEMSTEAEIVDIALKTGPDQATLVPEKRQELTTEGGLDVVRFKKKIAGAVDRLISKDISVSIFVDPKISQVKASKDIGAQYVEIHTGSYANAHDRRARSRELKKIKEAALYAHKLGLGVNAGHGLDYENVKPVADIDVIEEFNIGFSIVACAVFVGLETAVSRMKALITG